MLCSSTCSLSMTTQLMLMLVILLPFHISANAGSAEAHFQQAPSEAEHAQSQSTSHMAYDLVSWSLRDALYEAALTLSVFAITSCVLIVFQRWQRRMKTSSGSKRSARVSAAAALPNLSDDLDSTQLSFGTNPGPTHNYAKRSNDLAVGTGTLAPANHALRARSRMGALNGSQKLVSETDHISASVRSGRSSDLPSLLDAALSRLCANNSNDVQFRENCAKQLLLSALRGCASAQRFYDALVAFDHCQSFIGDGCQAIWSLVLYSATQTGCFKRCWPLFERLCEQGHPSCHDVVNMIRCCAAQDDAQILQCALQKLQSLGCKLDTVTHNRALAACTSAGALELAEILMADNCLREGALDAIAYNTMIKGYAKAGKSARCFELREAMEAHGLPPSEITFGILLDACVSAHDFKGVKAVFNDLCNSGLQLNTVHYTSLLKGLVATGQLEEANRVLHTMIQSPGAEPDLVTYATLIKVHVDKGDFSHALQVFEVMCQQKVEPDDVIIRCILLSRCGVNIYDPRSVLNLFEMLVQRGMEASNSMFARMMKILQQNKAWESALYFIQQAPACFKVVPERKHFINLIRACVRAGQRHVALSAHHYMETAVLHGGEKLDDATLGQLLSWDNVDSQSNARWKLRDSFDSCRF